LKPPARIKLFYSFGQVVESCYLTAATYVFFYYTAVLGLSGSTVGMALAISMVLDAMADPFIGSWSDNVRSKLGRRLPLMLVGAPLTVLSMGLLFHPPAGLAPFLLFGWLTLTKMAVRAFASMYNIPYFALGGEMSDDYVERSRIVAWRLLAGILASTSVVVLGIVCFRGEGGLQDPDRYPMFGWAIAAIVLVGSLACVAGLWRHAPALPQPTTPRQSFSALRLFRELAEIFSNGSFRLLFLTLLVFTSAAGVAQALNNHAYVFVWQLRPEWIQGLGLIGLFGIFLGVPLTPVLLQWIEKKTAAIVGFLLVVSAFLVLPTLRATGLYAPTGSEAMTWLLITTLFIGLGTGVVFIAYPSMMADAAEEHEHRYGDRREGLYFAGLGFAGKAAAGMGALVGGLSLDMLRFPREVGREVHAVIAEPILRELVFAWAIVPALMVLVAALALIPYAVTRERHAVITADLRARRMNLEV
jgi:GPH family glycoside/pentoside/hexuronide:cation symporter